MQEEIDLLNHEKDEMQNQIDTLTETINNLQTSMLERTIEMEEIKLNHTFEFELSNFQFDIIPYNMLIEIYKDGRYSSQFLEKWLALKFKGLTWVAGNKGHDHIDCDGTLYDAKSFTPQGLGFAPSNQIGANRKFNKEIAHEKADKLIYICCDIVDFPKLRVRFIQGKILSQEYPKCHIPFKKREHLFSNAKQCEYKKKNIEDYRDTFRKIGLPVVTAKKEEQTIRYI